MIITQKKPIEEVMALVGDAKTVAIVGCNSCATACQTGGEAQIAELTAEFGIRTDVMSDAELALNAAFGPEADGMLVISGTGSVVFLRKNGTLLRAGGWGHILGDGGRGAHPAFIPGGGCPPPDPAGHFPLRRYKIYGSGVKTAAF